LSGTRRRPRRIQQLNKARRGAGVEGLPVGALRPFVASCHSIVNVDRANTPGKTSAQRGHRRARPAAAAAATGARDQHYRPCGEKSKRRLSELCRQADEDGSARNQNRAPLGGVRRSCRAARGAPTSTEAAIAVRNGQGSGKLMLPNTPMEELRSLRTKGKAAGHLREI